MPRTARHAFGEADAIKADRNRLREEQHQPDGAAERQAERARDDVIDAAAFDLELVATAASEMLVRTEIALASTMMTSASPSPVMPTT